MVTVIIPVYNAEKYIEECLDSVLRQDYDNLEVILVDDGSMDRSSVICDLYAEHDSRITVIHKKNGGVSAARNEGLNIANGEYIYFADSDDILHKDLISSLVCTLESTNADIVSCSYEILKDGNIKSLSNNAEKTTKLDAKSFGEIIFSDEKYGGYLWNKLFKRTIAKKIRFAIEYKICEDEVFIMDYLECTTQGAVLDKNLYTYRDNSAGAMRQGLNENMLTNALSRSYVLDCMLKRSYDEALVKKRYYELIYTACAYYRYVLFNKNVKNRTAWLSHLSKIYLRFRGIYKVNPAWTFSQKIILMSTGILIKARDKLVRE